MEKIKICLIAPPYSGHLNPLLGLGVALKERADVTVMSTPGAMAAAAAAGLKGIPILAEKEALVWEIASPGVTVGSHPQRLLRQLRINVSMLGDMLGELDVIFSALKPDLVIADFTLPVASTAAARCGARWWTTLPSPCVLETPDGPPPYFRGLAPARSWFGAIEHAALRKLTRLFKQAVFFAFRKKFRQVGLEQIYRADGSERVYSKEAILAIGIHELEFARTFPDYLHFIGPSFFTPSSATETPFFENGKKHLLVTFGTHLAHLKDGIARCLREIAAAHPEWVIHLTDGGTGPGHSIHEGNFHRYGFISYDQHLHRYDLVMHHGGAGIMLKCLEQGLPALVMPVDFDQFDNAARLVHAGVARRVRSFGEIPAAISEVMQDEVMATRCREMARIVAGYHSGKTVCALVKKAFS